MKAHELSAQLSAHSLKIGTEIQRTRLNGKLPEVDRSYLQIEGTPEAYRWLATLLTELANNRGSAILDPAELRQLSAAQWSAIELSCRIELPK